MTTAPASARTRSADATEVAATGLFSSPWKAGAALTGISILATAALTALATGPGGIEIAVDVNGQRQAIAPLMVIPITVMSGLLASVAAWLLAKRGSQGRTLFAVLAVVGTVLSFGTILGATSTSAKVVLAVLHVITGAIIAGGLLASKVWRSA